MPEPNATLGYIGHEEERADAEDLGPVAHRRMYVGHDVAQLVEVADVWGAQAAPGVAVLIGADSHAQRRSICHASSVGHLTNRR
ncbi:MAG: hypothetical protein AB7V43_12685 [Acidimicrobiia bacterium]